MKKCLSGFSGENAITNNQKQCTELKCCTLKVPREKDFNLGKF